MVKIFMSLREEEEIDEGPNIATKIMTLIFIL